MNSAQHNITCTACGVSGHETTAVNSREKKTFTCCEALAFELAADKAIRERNYRKAMSGPKRPMRYAFSDGSKFDFQPRRSF